MKTTYSAMYQKEPEIQPIQVPPNAPVPPEIVPEPEKKPAGYPPETPPLQPQPEVAPVPKLGF